MIVERIRRGAMRRTKFLRFRPSPLALSLRDFSNTLQTKGPAMPGLCFVAMTNDQTAGTVTPYVHDTL